jgi:hypothetical protein
MGEWTMAQLSITGARHRQRHALARLHRGDDLSDLPDSSHRYGRDGMFLYLERVSPWSQIPTTPSRYL